jgi:spermidine/putrescine transport system substrate-binding protein
MEKLDPELAKNPLIFPTQEDYEALSIFRGLTEEEELQFGSEFQDIAV